MTIERQQAQTKELRELFGSPFSVATDVDDTLVTPDVNYLQAKLAAALLFQKVEAIDPNEFISLLKDPLQMEQYLRHLAEHGALIYEMSPSDFLQAIYDWVTGTTIEGIREDVVLNRLRFKDMPSFWAQYRAYSNLYRVPVSQYLTLTPGCLEFYEEVKKLRESGRIQHFAVVTNSDSKRLAPILEFFQAETGMTPDTVLSARDIGALKPAPHAFHVLNRELGEQHLTGNRIYIGNGDEDILAATQSGWRPIIINPFSREMNTNAGSFAAVPSYHAITSALHNNA